MRLFIWFGLLPILTACISLSPADRRLHADTLTAASGWQQLLLPTEQFVLMAYVPGKQATSTTLTIYIEGDGLAWLSSTRPSPDPTPRRPLALELALKQQSGAVAYLARPCQYVQGRDRRGCNTRYWTSARFAPAVITAANQGVELLKKGSGAKQLVLVGYSGGGAIAALVAARRNDIARLITIAGNLDHQAWAQHHRVSPLTGSLNPADEWANLTGIPQLHMVGMQDNIVPSLVAESYQARFPNDKKPPIQPMPQFDHHCCWLERWPELLRTAAGQSL